MSTGFPSMASYSVGSSSVISEPMISVQLLPAMRNRNTVAKPGATQLFSGHKRVVHWLRLESFELIADQLTDVREDPPLAVPGNFAEATLR